MNIQCPWCQKDYTLFLAKVPETAMLAVCPSCGGDHHLMPPAKMEETETDGHAPTLSAPGHGATATRQVVSGIEQQGTKAVPGLAIEGLDLSEDASFSGESAHELRLEQERINPDLLKAAEPVIETPKSEVPDKLELDREPEADPDENEAYFKQPAIALDLSSQPFKDIDTDEQDLRESSSLSEQSDESGHIVEKELKEERKKKMRAQPVYKQGAVRGAKKEKSKAPQIALLVALLAGGGYLAREPILDLVQKIQAQLSAFNANEDAGGQHAFKSQIEVWASQQQGRPDLTPEAAQEKISTIISGGEKLAEAERVARDQVIQNPDDPQAIARHLMTVETLESKGIQTLNADTLEIERDYFNQLNSASDYSRLVDRSLDAASGAYVSEEEMKRLLLDEAHPELTYPIANRLSYVRPELVYAYCEKVLKKKPGDHLHLALKGKAAFLTHRYDEVVAIAEQFDDRISSESLFVIVWADLIFGKVDDARNKLSTFVKTKTADKHILRLWRFVETELRHDAKNAWDTIQPTYTSRLPLDMQQEFLIAALAARDVALAEDIETDIQKVHSKDDEDIPFIVSQAVLAYLNADFKKAAKTFDRVFGINKKAGVYLSQQPWIALFAGLSYEQLEDKDNAKIRYRAALQEDIGHFEAMMLLTLSNFEDGEKSAPLEPIDGLRHGDVTDWFTPVGADVIYLPRDVALEYVDKRLKETTYKDGSQTLSLLKGIAAYRHRQSKKAIKSLNQFLGKNTRNQPARILQALIYNEQKAISKLDRSLRIYKKYDRSDLVLRQFLEARSNYLEGRHNRAIKDLSELTEAHAYYVPGLKGLTSMLRQKRPETPVDQYLKKLVELRPTVLEYKTWLYEALVKPTADK